MYLPSSATDTPEIVRSGGWVKSTKSNGCLACVEILSLNDGRVHIRDSKYRRDTTKPWHLEPVISISTSEFARLIDHVRGTGDGAVVFDEIVIEESEHEGVTLSSRTTGAVLHFHDYEWAAFRDGAIEGEFSSACRAAGV